MKVIVCLDQRNGMSFCGKRQSMDRCLREHLAGVVQSEMLWMNAYSVGQFSDTTLNIHVDDAYLDKAGENEFCFVENRDLTPYMDKIHWLGVYRWDRLYPSNLSFPLDKVKDKLQLLYTEVFEGFSHKQIQLEVYQQ